MTDIYKPCNTASQAALQYEIESLRQQLDAAEANCQCELIKLEQQLAECQARATNAEDRAINSLQAHYKDELDLLTKQLDEIQEQAIKDVNHFRTAVAESQAREKVLREVVQLAWLDDIPDGVSPEDVMDKAEAALALPSDFTALDSAIRQAKREALLEAINEWEKPYGLTDGSPFIERLRRMADNLKD